MGLGNPGDRYSGTRHNVGFDVVQAFAEKAAGGPPRLDRLDCRALTGRVRVGDRPVLVARPQTYMNLSGESVKGLALKYEVPLDGLVVVSDDTALPVGTIRIRRSGSVALGTFASSHATISAIEGVRGDNFQPGEPLDTYVLSRFSKKERPAIDAAIDTAIDALTVFVTDGIEAAMNRFNRSSEESASAN